jgi:hypothetical protein
MSKCKKCNEGELEYCFDYSFGEAETWACDKCDVTVVVPVTIERHFDDVDWSCADDK